MNLAKRVPASFVDAYNSLPRLRNVDPFLLHEKSGCRIRDETYFDMIMKRCGAMAMHEAFEPILLNMFGVERAVVWEENSGLGCYASQFLKASVAKSHPLIRDIESERKCVVFEALKDESVSQFFKAEMRLCHMFFPLVVRGSVIAIVHLTKALEFTEEDRARSAFLTRKFSVYGALLFFPSFGVGVASEIAHFGDLGRTVERLYGLFQERFGAAIVDFWCFSTENNTLSRFDRSMGQFVVMLRGNTGIIGSVVKGEMTVNVTHCRSHAAYVEPIDGDGDRPALMSSCDFGLRTWAMALRGPKRGISRTYSRRDEELMSELMPFVARALAFASEACVQPQKILDGLEQPFLDRIALASSVTPVLEIKDLLITIEEKVRIALDCEKCHIVHSVFSTGITETVAASHIPVIIANPHCERRFNSEFDVGDKSSQVQSLLSFPVISKRRNSTVAVLNCVNKANGEFSDGDIERLTLLSCFFAVAVENALAYEKAMMITRNVRDVLRTCTSKVQKGTLNSVLGRILERAVEIVEAKTASVFLIKDSNELFFFLSTGDAEEHLKEVAQRVTETGQTTVLPSSAHDGCVACIPLRGDNRSIVGALEFECIREDPSYDELLLMEAIGASVAVLYNRFLSDEMSNDEIQRESIFATDEERSSFKTPPLEVPRDFSIQECDEKTLYVLVFHVFDEYQLKEAFRISNQTLYMFLLEISRQYRNDVYQNWRHAVKTLNFCFQCLSVTKIDQVMTKPELLALVIAGLCHDVGHKGARFSNNKAYSLLLQKQSFFELEHLKLAMNTMLKDECNLFGQLTIDWQRTLWDLVSELVLATDMAKHFSLIKHYQSLVESKAFQLREDQHRLLLMKLILKCGDLSDCVQSTFEDPRGVCSEIYTQCDLSAVPGIVRDSKGDIDEIASQGAILNFVILPLFETLASTYSEMSVCVQKIEDNIKKLKLDCPRPGVQAPNNEKGGAE